MTGPSKTGWQELASLLFCVLVAIGALFLVGKYLLIAVLPFLIAWGTALMLRPLAKLVAEKSGLPQKLCATLLLLTLFLLIGLLLVFTVSKLLSESGRLLERLSAESDKIGAYLAALAERISSLGERIPILRELSNIKGLEALDGYIDSLLSEVVRTLTSAITTRLPSLIGGFISALPSFLLFFIISVMASFYFTLDLDTIHSFLGSFLPQKISARLPALQKGFKNFLTRYLRAYSIILFLTFCELYVGFSVLSLEYRLLPAILIALVDVFPVLGVGTVLLPWAAIVLLGGNYYLGFGLIILWAAVTVVRQIIEPRIVGGTLGVHPVLMLIAMYIGFRLFGILGILLSPAAITVTRFFMKELKGRTTVS
ncbi:MAG: sporulation integral membrane protein YtvI [Clostridia bacterium]|nr:sporulation integral membrane protein YtvI [Clostridia bacterium]